MKQLPNTVSLCDECTQECYHAVQRVRDRLSSESNTHRFLIYGLASPASTSSSPSLSTLPARPTYSILQLPSLQKAELFTNSCIASYQ